MIKNKEITVDDYIIDVEYDTENGDITALIINGDVSGVLRDSFLNRVTSYFYGSLLDE